jgi:hypothetical protein
MQFVVRLRRLGTSHERHALRLQIVGHMARDEAQMQSSYGRLYSPPVGLPSSRISLPGLTFHDRGRFDSMVVASFAGQETLPCRAMHQ